VPRFYLEGFCDPALQKHEGKNVLWVYEKRKDIRRSSPKREATIRDFYTHTNPDGAHSTEVEERLGVIENNAARVLQSGGPLDGSMLAAEDRQWLALFVGTMFTRTPTGRTILDTRAGPAVERIITQAAQHPDEFRRLLYEITDPEEIAGVDVEEARQRILSGAHVGFNSSAELSLASVIHVGWMSAAELLKLDWQFVYAHEEELFLTSDSPVVSMVWESNNSAQFLTGFGVPGVDIYFPLTRDVCLHIRKGVPPGTCIVVDRGVRQINKLVMASAEKRIYAAEHSERLRSAFEKYGCEVRAEDFQPRWQGKPV